MIFGYKAFNSDFTNRYGQMFEAGKLYSLNNEDVKFQKNGFHFCERLEDTLRYYDGFSDIKIAKVVGLGNIDEYEDNYYGYYHMYSAEKIYISYFLSREEIIKYILDVAKGNPYFSDRTIRFVSGFRITEEEKDKLVSATIDDKERKKLVKAIQYYQEDKKDVYY